MSRVVGYTRPLSGDQPGADETVLRDAGAATVLHETGTRTGRNTRLPADLGELTAGDVLVVSSGVRLARSQAELIRTIRDLGDRGVGLRILDEPALSTNHVPIGPVDVVAALDRVRGQMISVRTKETMAKAAARNTGNAPGRPTVMTADRVAMAKELRGVGRSMAQIARILGVSTGAVSRALHHDDEHTPVP